MRKGWLEASLAVPSNLADVDNPALIGERYQAAGGDDG